MAKKQILSLVAASLVAAAFVGCGSSSSDTPLTVTVSDAYVYGATVTKGGKAFDTMDGATYTWNDMPDGDLASTGGANDLNGNGMADEADPLAIDMKAPAGYTNINPLTTLEANGLSLNDINAKYGLSLETTDIDIVKAAEGDLAVYKAAAMAALEIANGTTTVSPETPNTETNTSTETNTTAETNTTTETNTTSVAPASPTAIQFRAIAPVGPDAGTTTTTTTTTDENGTTTTTTTGSDLTAINAAINAATDRAGVDAAVLPKMVELRGVYTPPVTEAADDATTETNTSGEAVDCLPGEDCTQTEDMNTSGEATDCLPGEDCTQTEDTNTSDEDNTTTVVDMGDMVAPNTP